MLISALIFRAAAARSRYHPRLSLRAEIHKLTHLRGARGRPVVAPLHLRFGALSADNYPAIDVSLRGGSSAPKTATKTRDGELAQAEREGEKEREREGGYRRIWQIAGNCRPFVCKSIQCSPRALRPPPIPVANVHRKRQEGAFAAPLPSPEIARGCSDHSGETVICVATIYYLGKRYLNTDTRAENFHVYVHRFFSPRYSNTDVRT